MRRHTAVSVVVGFAIALPVAVILSTMVAGLTLMTGTIRAEEEKPAAPAGSTTLAAPRLVKLSKEHSIWVDARRKLVVVDGEVAMREGPLEMFACPKGTKEHESVVAIHCNGQLIHAGLLAVGAQPNHPVKFNPEYVPASGSIIDIMILWEDEEGRHKVRAQEWVMNEETKKAMQHDWVFGGSGFWTDETTGRKYYHADAGDLICVSNFSTAMLDLPIESSQANDGLLYSAFTKNIPPRGTKVRLVLSPRRKNESLSLRESREERAERANPWQHKPPR